eukprot:PhM_4_TR737/c0_g1_i1/m.69568/K09584/PDIA6, TXNDC7; protein disulfide-isomerase A6
MTATTSVTLLPPLLVIVLLTTSFCLSEVTAFRPHVTQDPELPIEGVVEMTALHNIDPDTGAINVTSILPEEIAASEAELASTYIFVELYTSWCFWCRQFTPVLSQLGAHVIAMNSTEPRIVLAKMSLEDADTDAVRARYDVMFFPTVLMLLPNGTHVTFPEEEERSLHNMITFIARTTGVVVPIPEAPTEVVAHTRGTSLHITTNRTFEHVVYGMSQHVIVFFYAPWCSVCEMLRPMWDELASSQASFSDRTIAHVDIEELPYAAEHFKLSSLPTIIAFTRDHKQGTLRYRGTDDLPSLEQWLLQVCTPKNEA